MGQTRPVTVKKFVVKGTVEERILKVAKDRDGGGAGKAGANAGALVLAAGPSGKARAAVCWLADARGPPEAGLPGLLGWNAEPW